MTEIYKQVHHEQIVKFLYMKALLHVSAAAHSHLQVVVQDLYSVIIRLFNCKWYNIY